MRKRIGEFLVEKGVLTPTQVDQILKHGQETGLRFGEAGIDLGILSQERLVQVFGPSFAVDFFYLDARNFPKISRDLLPLEVLLRLGALPLGFKTEHKFFRPRRVLNLGLLDPARKDAAEEALRIVTSKLGKNEVQDVKVFLILADQFLSVLEQVYGTSDAELSSRDNSQLDGTLLMFLDQGR